MSEDVKRDIQTEFGPVSEDEFSELRQTPIGFATGMTADRFKRITGRAPSEGLWAAVHKEYDMNHEAVIVTAVGANGQGQSFADCESWCARANRNGCNYRPCRMPDLKPAYLMGQSREH